MGQETGRGTEEEGVGQKRKVVGQEKKGVDRRERVSDRRGSGGTGEDRGWDRRKGVEQDMVCKL